ncbi:inositol hexakisphosphate [Hamiltosporidium tvaerminnensis]|uniref:Inositol hexakisphosphate n=1 Tax=Hamiltosporidium tvaerminnensis TaxID=1176355 RepID=A0A4Q9L503_9MICR|nr:inositol hexakisphosphate [Hamiltosporidium tvaerminnensis]
MEINKYSRFGFILTSSSILKCELNFSKHTNKSKELENNINTHSTYKNIHGIGQLTTSELEIFFEKFSCEEEIFWFNLREEPMIFINSCSFVLKDKNNPFEDIKFMKGVSCENLEIFEERLKREIIYEAEINGGFLQVNSENKKNETTTFFIIPYEILTVKEVFQNFKKKYKNLKYFRIPISSHSYISDTNSLNFLHKILYQSYSNTRIFIFNSKRGYTRVKFAITFCYLTVGEINSNNFLFSIQNTLKMFFEKLKRIIETKNKEKINDFDLKKNEIQIILKIACQGKYRVVENLLSILKNKKAKLNVDIALYNIYGEEDFKKDIIHKYFKYLLYKDTKYLNEAILRLEKYITLILYEEYLFTMKPVFYNIGFQAWLRSNISYVNLFKYISRKKDKLFIFSPLNLLPNINIEFNFLNILKKNKYYILKEHVPFCCRTTADKINFVPNLSEKYILADKKSVWFNLLEEPCIYIKNKFFIYRDYQKFYKNPTFFRGIDCQEIEKTEFEIKNQLLNELKRESKLIVYKEKTDGIKPYEILDIKYEDILTSIEYISKYKKTENFIYLRFPITSSLPLRFETFDKLFEHVSRFEKDSYFYVQSNGRKGRCVYISLLINLIYNWKYNINIETEDSKFHFKIIQRLVSVLENGIEAKNRIDHYFQIYFQESFIQFFLSIDFEKYKIRAIKRYFVLICFSSYLYNQSCKSFEEFMMNRLEILNMYNELNEITENNFFYDLSGFKDESICHVKKRNAHILGSMMILKYDYFIGSNIFSLPNAIKETQNFRYVVTGDNIICGIAMPTRKAIENVLKKMRSLSKNFENNIYWFCLREEPVIYINDHPYVLRNVEKLSENIETRGISVEIVENIENKLKNEILDELNEGMLLVHKEIIKNGEYITKGVWVKVNSVETTKEIFLKNSCIFKRYPITDERIPIPSIIDNIYKFIREIKESKLLIFNCQMGRGRTTTGMVIAKLVCDKDKIPSEKSRFYPPKYKIIELLLKILPAAQLSKQKLDEVIDFFDHLENLRNVIDDYNNGSNERISKGKRYLSRYFYLICFCNFYYQTDEESFVSYLEKRHEISNLEMEIENLGLEFV